MERRVLEAVEFEKDVGVGWTQQDKEVLERMKGDGTVLGFKIGYDEWVSGGRLGA